jgi:hypothetical protein
MYGIGISACVTVFSFRDGNVSDPGDSFMADL